MAITEHVVAFRAASVDTPLRLEIVHVELAGESVKVVAPVPEPPEVVKVIVVPTGFVVVVFEIVNGVSRLKLLTNKSLLGVLVYQPEPT